MYTFGAPRTGNHAFARDYEAHCPSTWHVINDRSAAAVLCPSHPSLLYGLLSALAASPSILGEFHEHCPQ